MIFLSKKKVDAHEELSAEITNAARDLFRAYTKALPDKDDWLGRWGWNGNVGEITFDEQEICYDYSYYSHGDTSYFHLQLPIAALYIDNFIHEEVTRWEEKKRLAEVAKKEKEAKKQADTEKTLYQHYLELKRKYE